MAARAVYREFSIYKNTVKRGVFWFLDFCSRFRIFKYIWGVWEYSHWMRLEILHVLALQMPRELLRQSSLGLQLCLCLYLVLGTKYLVLGTKYQVLGTWYQVLSTWYLVPSTKYLVLGSKCLVTGNKYLIWTSCKDTVASLNWTSVRALEAFVAPKRAECRSTSAWPQLWGCYLSPEIHFWRKTSTTVAC